MNWRILAVAAALLALLGGTALAHVERTAYWPDPKPDTRVSPPAGGKVPKIRSLRSALKKAPPGKTRVVCHKNSLKLARRDIRSARSKGFRYRPMGGVVKLTADRARYWRTVNRKLFKRCKFSEIQPAVTKSHNNDRVVVMPGLYTEPTSRKVPKFPAECEQYRTTSEKGSGAVSYPYQFHCPNAQALVAVIGRALGPGQDPATTPTSRPDPHGIPNEGPCIRCNLQLEGSGPNPANVVVDAGRVKSGDGAPRGSKKDLTLKADRADGFVLRRMTLRHADEHDVYVLETDGYQLNRGRYMYAGEYGTLTFASDHGVTRICEAMGNGDAGVYPGGAPDSSGAQRVDSFYPKDRLNQLITRCDSHHNNLGYSGTMGNATHIYKNNFYDNTTGIATDSFYAGGHPGFPQNAAKFEQNRIFSNNFNIYGKDSDVESTTSVPIGVGILIAGGNENHIVGNYIYDNWRRGAMLIAVPDAISCAPNTSGIPPCTPEGAATTSQNNDYSGNTMGRSPSGEVLPNGVDFWWDEFPSNKGNCFGPNRGSDGAMDTTTTDPPTSPSDQPVPGFIAKKNCNDPGNVGTGDSAKEAVLVDCAEEVEGTQNGQTACDWYNEPAKPGTAAARQQAAQTRSQAARLRGAGFPALPHLCTLLGGDGGTLTCSPFAHRIS